MDVKRINDFVRNLDSAINITGITVYGVDDEGHSVKIDTEMLTNPKPTFTEASTRTNIVGSGESTTTLWGKVKKFFTDLADLAFINKPSSGQNTTYLRGDGTWQTPPNTTYSLSATDEKITLTPSQGSASEVSLNTLINSLETATANPQDDDYIIAQYAGGGTTQTTYYRRPLSKFWNWIKTKLGMGTNDGTFLRKDGTWATPSGTTYSAGQGLVKDGSTFKIGSGTNVHLSKKGAKSGDYILITINDYNAWMLSFKVRLYGDYKCDEYIISGYNLGSSYWYSPSVVLINSSGENRDVKFGYTTQTHLWVAIPNANYYGVDVLDVVCGYHQVNSYDGLFTLTETSSLSGTTQTTITASPLVKKSEIPNVVYRGSLQHNLQVMTSGTNLIHVHCQDFENDNICLDCYIAARGTTGSSSTFTWHYVYNIIDRTKLDIQCNYNGVINVINRTGRDDSDFILFINKLI